MREGGSCSALWLVLYERMDLDYENLAFGGIIVLMISVGFDILKSDDAFVKMRINRA